MQFSLEGQRDLDSTVSSVVTVITEITLWPTRVLHVLIMPG